MWHDNREHGLGRHHPEPAVGYGRLTPLPASVKNGGIPLNERMKAELAGYVQSLKVRDPKEALFATQRSAAFSANSLTQIVNGIYKQAGLDGASRHSGRRTFLTNLAERGVSVRVMMALAGHRNMATTQRYIDLRPGVLRNAIELGRR